MNDLLDPVAVEERLRRTLAVRADDIPPGGEEMPSARPVHSPRRRRFPTTVVLTAAAVAVVVGAALATLWPERDDELVVRGRETERQESPPTTEPTTETSTPNWSWTDYGIARFETAESTVNVQFDSGADTEMMEQNDIWQAVEAGPNRGYYAALPDGAIGELRLVFEDGIVSLMGGAVPREELMAAGATVRFDPATGMYTLTPPPGWTVLSMTTPEDLAAQSTPSPSVGGPVSLGFFACDASPTEKTFGVTWYPGWTRDNIPDDARLVGGGNGVPEVWFGTIAPEAGDLFQVWILHPDGAVELQGAVMTEAELVEAASGVERLPGGSFAVTPPPCFASDGG